LAGDAVQLCDSPVFRQLIREREHRLKKNLARIDNPRAQELWTGDSGTAQLEYGWFISQRLVGDIFDGLETADALARREATSAEAAAPASWLQALCGDGTTFSLDLISALLFPCLSRSLTGSSGGYRGQCLSRGVRKS
jgi:hypothetical protein